MVKVAPYVILLIQMVAIPLLKLLIPPLRKEAAKTETDIDDSLVGAFEVVLDTFQNGGIFIPKEKK